MNTDTEEKRLYEVLAMESGERIRQFHLVQSSLKGDKEKEREVLEIIESYLKRYLPGYLYKKGYQITETDLKEIIYRTLFKCHHDFYQFAGKSLVTTWAFSYGKRIAFWHFQQKMRYEKHFTFVDAYARMEERQIHNPLDYLILQEKYHAVRTALKVLNEAERSILIQVILEGISMRSISRTYHVSYYLIRKRYHRALSQLKHHFLRLYYKTDKKPKEKKGAV